MQLKQLDLEHYLTKLKQLKIQHQISTANLARIFSENKTGWNLTSDSGQLTGILLNSRRRQLNSDSLPKVGDWVQFEKLTGENKAKIIKVLPRFSSLVRHLEKKRINQTIATNIDVMFVVLSVDQIFNPLQLNRYLTIAMDGGITPIVVINKIDQTQNLALAKKIANQILSTHPRLTIIQVSAKSKTGLTSLARQIPTGYSAVLVGNSGVGKSTIVNALLTHANQSTQEVNEFGKGRHTTTSRKVFVLPNGGIIIDTPGMRTLEFDPNKQSENSIFAELTTLSLQCKFKNCEHVKSAGCAIQNALTKKLISAEQLDQFLNLNRKHIRPTSYHKAKR